MIAIFITIHFEDFFDIFITISKQVSRVWPTEGQMGADGGVINCSAFHYFGSIRKFVYDKVDSN